MRRLTTVACCVLLGAASLKAAPPGDDPSGPTDKAELYASWYRPATAAAYVYLKNNGSSPLTLAKLLVNGQAESATPWPLDPHRNTDWFDLLPRTIAPGQIGQLRVHLRGPAAKAAVDLTLELSDGGTARCSIDPVAAPVNFTDITFARDGSDAALYVRCDRAVHQVLEDGRDITADCDLRGAAPTDHIAGVFVHANPPLERGSYHTWEVRTDGGGWAIYTARTLSNPFIIGTYGKPNFQPYKDDAVNHYISFGMVPASKFAELASLGMSGSYVPFVGGTIDAKTHQYKPFEEQATHQRMEGIVGNSALAYYSAPDEPDGADYPLGVGTLGRSIIAMREFATQVDPATPSFVQIDNTYKNQNYHVYAESMDYCASHRYNLGQDFLAGDREGMQELRDATAPLPYLWVTQLYPVREKVGEHSKYNGRDPLPAEMHIQMLEALGGGTKGFIHYIHSGSSAGGRGGSGQNKPLWTAMGPMHQQIAAVGDLAVRSTPVDWASASDSRVHVSTLWCGPSDVLVVATNDAIVSTKTDVTVPPIQDVSFHVNLPTWFHAADAKEVLLGGQLQPIAFNQPASSFTTALTQPLKEGTILWIHGVH